MPHLSPLNWTMLFLMTYLLMKKYEMKNEITNPSINAPS